MSSIELVWDADCPNVDAARGNLRDALRELGVPADWTEWRSDDPDAPARARRAGSPAILIDGVDVVAHEGGEHACCRIYVGADGRRAGAPTVAIIVDALRRAGHTPEGAPARSA